LVFTTLVLAALLTAGTLLLRTVVRVAAWLTLPRTIGPAELRTLDGADERDIVGPALRDMVGPALL
jgi:hypothetical protein